MMLGAEPHWLLRRAEPPGTQNLASAPMRSTQAACGPWIPGVGSKPVGRSSAAANPQSPCTVGPRCWILDEPHPQSLHPRKLRQLFGVLRRLARARATNHLADYADVSKEVLRPGATK